MTSKVSADADETLSPTDTLGYARSRLRHNPELKWNDGAGAHSAAVAQRAVVGSAAGVDVLLADPTVSRLHAEFELRDDGLWVHDLGSRNGTYIDHILVTAGRIPDGSSVRLGNTDITVSYAKAGTPVPLWPGDRYGPLLGRSVAMRELFSQLARIAMVDSTILVTGETGTGKEVVARAIHDTSPRASHPMVIVDCASLPEALLETELFGHAKGAFTGAAAARTGAIEEGDGSTVFLDEIGELPLSMQPKLLRVIESRTVRRVGETSHRPVDVRFICATHRDLASMVNAGAFREDLYFRLAVLPVTIPPLRDRREDIPALVEHFLAGKIRGTPPAELLAELMRRPWLGNVRELRNFAERAVALGAAEALASMPAKAGSAISGERGKYPPVSLDVPYKDVRDDWIEHLERSYVEGLLARHGHNVVAVAQASGLARTYVHRLIRKHNL